MVEGIEISRLLSQAEMAKADHRTIAGGIPGKTLMERAGRLVAEIIQKHFTPCPTLILCGPGNNGGDGFVIAHYLKKAGWPITVATQEGDITSYTGDAAHMAKRYKGTIVPFGPSIFDGNELAVDALFGTGLNRPVEKIFGQVLHALIKSKLPVIAVDIPSGINGDTGQVMGIAAPAAITVTFARKKLGHTLIPGRVFCGEIIVADIGIPENIIAEVATDCFENTPLLWKEKMPWPRVEQHKYDRGHALVMGGHRACTGAAKLAAHAALRIGAGLVTIVCTEAALPVYAPALAAVMVHPLDHAKDIPGYCKKRKISSALIGPGYGVSEKTRKAVLMLLKQEIPIVLDADALTSFEGHASALFGVIKTRKKPVILTPHAAEFKRLFGVFAADEKGKISLAREAAQQSGAFILFKGADTVIASPQGHAYVNINAPATLATAGSGDVLSGLVLGLLAAGMPTLEATAAAVWIHGECANRFGLGFTADDFDHMLPEVLQHLAYGANS